MLPMLKQSFEEHRVYQQLKPGKLGNQVHSLTKQNLSHGAAYLA